MAHLDLERLAALEQWGLERQRASFAAWKKGWPVKCVAYTVAVATAVDYVSCGPWRLCLKRWLVLTTKAMRATSTYNMGQWWPHGRFAPDALAHLRRLFNSR